jgi:hypothetical protein
MHRETTSTGTIAARDSLTGDLADFLAEVKVEHALIPHRRLIFGLDATASRKPTWDMAAGLQADMFREAASAGNLDLQLVFYRGDGECKASAWMSDSARLARIMSTIDVRAGTTQISKVLTHVRKEAALAPVGALVFIGDALEESIDPLCLAARALGEAKTHCFMFQEGADSEVEGVFRAIANHSGGAYGRFDSGAAKQLGELLKAVAVFATGGMKALEGRRDAGSVLLLGQLRGGDG